MRIEISCTETEECSFCDLKEGDVFTIPSIKNMIYIKQCSFLEFTSIDDKRSSKGIGNIFDTVIKLHIDKNNIVINNKLKGKK